MKSFLFVFLVGFCVHLSAQSDDSQELFDEAEYNYRQRNLDLARNQINRVVSRRPDAESHYLSGLIHEAAGNDLRALADYEATLTYDDTYREALFQRGLIHLRNNNSEKAISDFTKLLDNANLLGMTRGIFFQVDPSGQQQNKVVSVANFESQLLHYRGQAYESAGDYQSAMQDYNDAIQIEGLPEYLISRGLIKSKLEDMKGAVSDFQSVLSVDPANQLAWYNLALIDPSLKMPDSLLNSGDFTPTLHLLGSRALESGDYSLAKQYFDRYLLSHHSDALAYINRGRLQIKLGNHARARKDFTKALNLNRNHVESLYLIGNTYFFEKAYDNALSYYNQYLARDPANAMVWYNGAMSHLEMENMTEGCHFLRNAQKYGMAEADKMIQEHCR